MYKYLLLLFISHALMAATKCPELIRYAAKNSLLSHPQRLLITMVDQFGIDLDAFENCNASLVREEERLSTCLKINDRLLLSYESILNYYQIETLTFQKEINYRSKHDKYLALTIIKNKKRSEVDLLSNKLNKLADKDTTLEHTVYNLIKDNLATTSHAPKAHMISRRSQKIKNYYSNIYQASRFSKSAITAIPNHNNYLNGELLFSLINEAYNASTALTAPELFSKAQLLIKLNLIEKKLGNVYELSTQLQPLANTFALAAKKISTSKKIIHGQQWEIKDDFIKIVDSDQRALYTHIDNTKTRLITDFTQSLQQMENWLIRNDLHELLGEGKWMDQGASDLDQTSNFKEFKKKYKNVLKTQTRILMELAFEQEELSKRAFKLQSEHHALWQELYQLRNALKEDGPLALKAPLRQFSDNLALLMIIKL